MKPSSVSGTRRRREAADSGEVEDHVSDEWLPEGWIVEVKARRSGKKEKCYLSPSREHKFFSKLEVSRYIDSLQISSPKTEEKKNGTSKRSAENVVIEKVAAEGLPPGWIKEIKVTKKGGKIRRDPYYTDPTTGYIFRSMKDALRYVETGDVGRLASKPKEKGNDDVELEDDNISSAAEAKKQRLESSGTRGDCNEDLSSKFEVMARDEQSVKSSTCTDEECPPLSGQTSDGCVVDAELSCADLSKSKVTEEIEKQSGPAQVDSGSSPAVGGSPKKRPPENEAIVSDNSKQPPENGEIVCDNSKRRPGRKSKDRSNPNLPRRTSKRLAGVQVDPGLEVKINSRAHRVAVKDSNKVEARETESSITATLAHQAPEKIEQPEAGLETKPTNIARTSTDVLLDSSNSKYPSGDLTSPGKLDRKPGTVYEIEDRKECASILPSENPSDPEKINRGDDKSQSSLNLPLDILMDPCIEFAIKTLTESAFDASEAMDVLAGSSKSKQCSGDSAHLATPADHAGNGTPTLPKESLFIPEQIGKVQTENKEAEKRGNPNPLDLPCEDFWTDPCIEFAVKTLTGAIPLEYDMNIQNIAQQLNTTQSHGNNEVTFSNVDIYQADFWRPVDKTVFKQVDSPALTPQSGNVGFPGSVGFRNAAGGTSKRPHNARSK